MLLSFLWERKDMPTLKSLESNIGWVPLAVKPLTSRLIISSWAVPSHVTSVSSAESTSFLETMLRYSWELLRAPSPLLSRVVCYFDINFSLLSRQALQAASSKVTRDYGVIFNRWFVRAVVERPLHAGCFLKRFTCLTMDPGSARKREIVINASFSNWFS